MLCKLCGSTNIDITYHGYIRDGKVCSRTPAEVDVYKCKDCGVIWHNAGHDLKSYYESKQYRVELEETSEIDDFYKNHDIETLDKLKYAGTACFRDKKVADIGCGGGAFLDYISGVADTVIGIEPSEYYRGIMDNKGYSTFAYASEACEKFAGSLDVVTSFDVIEHVESPVEFLKDVYNLLKKGGQAIIGTPTDAPVMRELVGKEYEERLLFSTQHIWILNERSFRYTAEKAGFSDMKIRYVQRYGIGNLIAWLKEKKPMGNKGYDIIPHALDTAYMSNLEDNGISDYILIYLEK